MGNRPRGRDLPAAQAQEESWDEVSLRSPSTGLRGAGKSTHGQSARRRSLAILYVDTGAIYRTVGYHMWLMGIGPERTQTVSAGCLDDVNIEIQHQDDGVQHMILNGKDVTGEIRTPEMSKYASGVSAQKCVRDFLLGHAARSSRGSTTSSWTGATSGRSFLPQGADVKIFLTARAGGAGQAAALRS